jgi:hypothetical protein
LAGVGRGEVISVGRNRWWQVLLALPFVGLVCGPLFAARSPELFGLAFFYLYELAWVLAAAALSWFVYRPAAPEPHPAMPQRTKRDEEPRFTRDAVPSRARVRS